MYAKPSFNFFKSGFKGAVSRCNVGIVIHQLKALFKDYCGPSIFFYFIKATLYNLQKKIQCQNGLEVLDGLHNSRYGSFCCVRVILDDANICMDKHTRISSFYTCWAP